ncbi:MAG: SDR family oxidoreductase, partial [Gammaproteobacteria bacterium]|nr:SDR family oxidoreductase [Gammaproteobacteria bacterium]
AAHNLRINVIAPGLVATERFELIRSQQPTIIGDRLKEIPLARPGSMAEIAETVLWLLGPASGFLTGAVIPLDGGECAK